MASTGRAKDTVGPPGASLGTRPRAGAIVKVTSILSTEPYGRGAIELEFEGHGIGKLLVPLVVRRQARNEMPQNCRRLKQPLETMPDRRAA